MSFQIDQAEMHMMPANFGPCGGPRRRPDGKRFVADGAIVTDRYVVLAEAEDPAQLEAILPEGMKLAQPLLIVAIDYLTDIPWLAGNKYALMFFDIPVILDSDEGPLKGHFMSCIFENEVDPIITGREQLGYCKILCEIDDPVVDGTMVTLKASEYGNEFLSMTFDAGQYPQDPGAFQAFFADMATDIGVFHYKYMQQIAAPADKADSNYICMTPNVFEFPVDEYAKPVTPDQVMKPGFGEFSMNELTWEQSPAHYNVIKTLSGIKIKRCIGGLYNKFYNLNDLYSQRIVKEY